MDIDRWTAFLLASLVTAFTPGQAVLLTIANTLERGRRQALISASGNVIGLLLVAAATCTGLGVLMRQTPGALQALEAAGALYLVYLGLKAWWQPQPAHLAGGQSATTHWGLFLQGVTVAATNPKGILFFAALFPQFAGDGPGLARRFAILTTTFALCAMSAHLTYIAGAGWARGRAGVRIDARLARRCSGLLFVLLGVGLLAT